MITVATEMLQTRFLNVLEEFGFLRIDLDFTIIFCFFSDLKVAPLGMMTNPKNILSSMTPEMLEGLKQLLINSETTEIETVDEEEESLENISIGTYQFEDTSNMSFSLLMNSLNDGRNKTKSTIIAMMKGCIALVNSNGTYLLKELNYEYNIVTYRVATANELKHMLEFRVELYMTKYELDKLNEKRRAEHRSLITSRMYEKDAAKLLFNDTTLRQHLERYDSVHLVQVNENCFSLRRPPIRSLYLEKSIKYIPQTVKNFIDCIANRVEHKEAWFDLLDTISYQAEFPKKKACRFYINFEAEGKAGKSYSCAGLAKMFDQFAMVNVSPSAMKDAFNSWINDKLFISFEEAESDNYSDKEVNTFVKRWTSIDMSSRAMHTATKTGKNYAIAVMAANDPGLYGLTRSDVATKRRIVVLRFKKNNLSSAEWAVRSSWINDPSFGYSLHKYIREEYKRSPNYDPDGFKASYDAWTELQSLKKNSTDTLVPLLQFHEEFENYTRIPINYSILYKYLGSRISYVYATYVDMMELYKKHCALTNMKPASVETFKAQMQEHGWSYSNAKKMDGKQQAVFYIDKWEVVNENKEDEENNDEE